MNTKVYYSVSIWLGILPILLISLTWIAGVYAQPSNEHTFLLPYYFASAINAFFFPYALSVLWIRVVELSGSDPKFAFLQKLWWAGFVLMVLFWIVTGSIGLLNDATPELEGVSSLSDVFDKPQSLKTDFINNYSASVVSTMTVSLATAIQSIILCITIWITRKDVTQKGIRVLGFWSSALTGLTGMAFLITNRFFLDDLLYPPFFISDLYIAGPSLSQAPKLNIWSIVAPDNWELLAVLLFSILILGIDQKFIKVGIGFGLLVLVSLIHKAYFPENSIETESPDKFIIRHSHAPMGGTYFGVVIILYQIILWRNHKLVIWLSYLHLTIAVITELLLLFYKVPVEFDFSFLFLPVTVVSQSFILINYWLSTHYRAKPSVE